VKRGSSVPACTFRCGRTGFQRNYPDYGLLFGWNHAEIGPRSARSRRAGSGSSTCRPSGASVILATRAQPSPTRKKSPRRSAASWGATFSAAVSAFEQEFSAFVGVATRTVSGAAPKRSRRAAGCGVVPGDEVITVAHTAVAAVAAIRLTAASPFSWTSIRSSMRSIRRVSNGRSRQRPGPHAVIYSQAADLNRSFRSRAATVCA
jgi:hypothetical protein